MLPINEYGWIQAPHEVRNMVEVIEARKLEVPMAVRWRSQSLWELLLGDGQQFVNIYTREPGIYTLCFMNGLDKPYINLELHMTTQYPGDCKFYNAGTQDDLPSLLNRLRFSPVCPVYGEFYGVKPKGAAYITEIFYLYSVQVFDTSAPEKPRVGRAHKIPGYGHHICRYFLSFSSATRRSR